jgi:serine/threonine protein kinase
MTSFSLLQRNWTAMKIVIPPDSEERSGHFGTVRFGRCAAHDSGYRKWDACDVAVKTVQYQDHRSFMQEAQIMTTIIHPACLSIRAIDCTGRALVMNRMAFSLLDIIAKVRRGESPRLWDATAKSCAVLGIAAGLAYLHDHNPPIVHRDIKPENVLLDSNFRPKISDFGLSLVLTPNAALHNQGTELYFAPEMLTHAQGKSGSPATDIYAFGLTIWSLLAGQTPFERIENPGEYAIAGNRPPLQGIPNERYVALLQRWWNQDEKQRGTMRDVLLKADDLMLDGCDPKAFAEYKAVVLFGTETEKIVPPFSYAKELSA